MKIILVGCGKVGTALARQLSEEGHNVTIIDTNKARVEHISESYDVMALPATAPPSQRCPRQGSRKRTCSLQLPARTS